MDGTLFLSEEDVRQTLTMSEAIEIARRGLYADARGQVVGDKFYMPVGERGFIKPFSGYLEGEPYAFVKTFSYFVDHGSRQGVPSTGSHVLLFDASSGRLVCLMEAEWATGLKTGASTALIAQLLARTESQRLVIFGAGLQGEMHLRSLASCFKFERITLLDLRNRVAEALAGRMKAELGREVTSAPLSEREGVVRSADIVVTVTTGNQPLIEFDWLQPGAFVARLGSYQELALEVITEADKLIVDKWQYVSPRVPELKQLTAAGTYSRDQLHAECLEVVAGKVPGRESPQEVIVYIALGIWGEYAALLPEVYRRARDLGLGRFI